MSKFCFYTTQQYKCHNIENFSSTEKKSIWLFGDSMFDHSKFNNVKKYNIEELLSTQYNIKCRGKAIAGLTADSLYNVIKNKTFELEYDDTDKYILRNCDNKKVNISNQKISKNDLVFISIGANDFVDAIKNKKENMIQLLPIIIGKIISILKYYLQKLNNPKQLIYVIPYKHYVSDQMYFKLVNILKKELSVLQINFLSLEDFKLNIDYKIDTRFDDDAPHFTSIGVNRIVDMMKTKIENI